ncbi:MAG: LysR substrate-binding domain-containing protein, partial [Gammaproteobacteria bacterium]|nr:LysR substrate-binding domain-containing protein [Gammaproteobacteria bacterium]
AVARSVQHPLTGPLKMGVIPTIAPFLLPKILPAIRRRFPDLELYLKEEQTKKIHTLLQQGELDILLLALPVALTNTESMSLYTDAFKLAYKQGTRLIDPQDFTPSKLNQGVILLLEDGHCLREHALSACNLSRLEETNKFSASGLYSLIQMVNSDLGVTFIPQMAIDGGLLENTQVVTQDLKDHAYREIGLAWRKSSVRKQEFGLLADVILESV